MGTKPKAGEIWKESFKDGTGEYRDSVYCFVVEENGKLCGIWFSAPWKPAPLDNVEDGKDGWKRVFPQSSIESDHGCEGSCPVCRIGEVANHKCGACKVEFCSNCHGIINDVKSENVLACKC